MCGIFGIVQKDNVLNKQQLKKAVESLFLLSESRGKEASGFAIKSAEKILVFKSPLPASKIIKTREFRQTISNQDESDFCLIGHSRLVTNGYEHFNENNQPFVKNNIVGIHNGIIVNIEPLWKKYADETRLTDLDSEMIPTLIRRKLASGEKMGNALQFLFREIYGMTSTALLFSDYKNLILATNNGSLYYISTPNLFVFASEKYILQQFLKKGRLPNNWIVTHLFPNHYLSVNIRDLSISEIGLKDSVQIFSNIENEQENREVINIEKHFDNKQIIINRSLEHNNYLPEKEFLNAYEANKERIDHLTRCTKCLLPETFPFIEFDSEGVCNKCNKHEKQHLKDVQELEEILSKYRRNNGDPDCILGFSGGRDSSYILHYIKKVLGMTPLAYSYDWGMITDLARRNQARMCGKLGVEHILVSADIRNKRSNIHKNVSAWLKSPHLGTIPLFMAGDKQYFQFAEKLKKQNGIGLLIMGENPFEKTSFKVGFCGIRQQKKGNMSYHISLLNKFKMMSFYIYQYFKNPSYLNKSLIDTMGAFLSYYATSHNYLNLFDYIKWDEKEINELLQKEYEWETEPGYMSTWRIGDGTAAFYNYIYYTIAGFSENDTLRSNQIREGMISRGEGLQLIESENQPRWSSIKWYLDTINLDFEEVVKSINGIKKLY
jgi:glutamine---fructose-6-phosphate transaminase (isomerizing)